MADARGTFTFTVPDSTASFFADGGARHHSGNVLVDGQRVTRSSFTSQTTDATGSYTDRAQRIEASASVDGQVLSAVLVRQAGTVATTRVQVRTQ